LRNASSCWARWTRHAYDRAGQLVPAHVQSWASCSQQTDTYRARPRELVDRTLREGDALQGELWLAYALCYYCALRRADALRATWAAFRPDPRPHLALRAQKNGKDIMVPLQPLVWDRLLDQRGDADHAARILEHGDTTMRQLDAWMRRIGWDAEVYPKTAHELRKLAGYQWLNKAGLEWAAKVLGDHPSTVHRYYGDIDVASMPSIDMTSH